LFLGVTSHWGIACWPIPQVVEITWCFFQPLWKIWKSVGVIIPNIWKNKIHVPNHQPDYICSDSQMNIGMWGCFFRNCRWFDRNVHGNFTHEYEDINKDKLIIDLLWMFNEHGDWWGQKPGNLVWTILGRGQIRTLNGGDNSFLLVSMECSLGQTVVGSLVVTTNAWFEPTGWWFQSLWKIWKSVGMILHNIWKVIKVMFQTTNQMWYTDIYGAIVSSSLE
jgi:hypothetical protein